MRNELKTTIGGKEVLLVASFSNLQAIEKAFDSNIFDVVMKVSNRDVNLDGLSKILIHASEGNEENTLNGDDVAREMASNGITGLVEKISEFLTIAFSGGGDGKGKK